MTVQHDDELMDLVDENDNVIGQKHRSEIYAASVFNFRVVNGFIVNSKGELWIPRRREHKRNFPNCLDMSIAGHVISGESYDQAFAREAMEELNLDVRHHDVHLLGHLSPKDNVSVFMQVYEIKMDETPDFNQDEFVEYYWLKPQALLAKITCGDNSKSDLPPLIKKFYL